MENGEWRMKERPKIPHLIRTAPQFSVLHFQLDKLSSVER